VRKVNMSTKLMSKDFFMDKKLKWGMQNDNTVATPIKNKLRVAHFDAVSLTNTHNFFNNGTARSTNCA